VSRTWDFYRDLFQRDGVDGKGTSTFAVVHFMSGTSLADASPLADLAYWSPMLFGMIFGDGSYPQNPNGLAAVTELDIAAHEVTHGVADATAGFLPHGLSGALAEGDSDILGKMVQAWVEGGTPNATIPEFVAGDLTKWEIGHASRPSGPLRFMYLPSLDGASADAWYDGIDLLDIHNSSGPVNRFFYFLSQGASPDPGSQTHSEYLPDGMSGIGNDRATRIWYKTLTEHLLPDADFAAARTASITAAQELFGAGSVEETAVTSAWAAVNVGAAPGAPDPVRVSFPLVHGPDTFLGKSAVPTGVLAHVQLYPTRARVFIRYDVANTKDTRVDFTIGSTSGGDIAGNINADGSWTTPSFPFHGDLIPVTATSKADPRQFAKGQLLLVELDADTDDEADAIDLGAVAMAWGLPMVPNPAVAVAGQATATAVSDWDLAFFDEALMNGWPAAR
jgi:hypothetical protein